MKGQWGPGEEGRARRTPRKGREGLWGALTVAVLLEQRQVVALDLGAVEERVVGLLDDGPDQVEAVGDEDGLWRVRSEGDVASEMACASLEAKEIWPARA